MGHVLSRAPVYFAAAQVRHNPVAAITNDLSVRARIQEAFRALGYSDQQDLKQSIRVEVAGANVEVAQQPQLLCMNAAKTSAAVIQVDRYWLQTTHYLDFEAFRTSFLDGLKALHDVVSLDYIDAVSMRMLDAIVPNDGETLQDYLPPELLGLDKWAEKRNWDLVHQGTEHVFQTEKHRVIFRCARRPGDVGFPADSVPLGMELLERHKQVQRTHAVLDTDAALEKRHKIDITLVGEQLSAVKKDLSQCFKNIVLPHALEQWK